MQIKAPAELALEPNTPDDMEVGAIKYKNGVLQLNANKRITGISQEVWKYQIGGHQVLDKWFNIVVQLSRQKSKVFIMN